ncbi:DUF362 domain-containing protein [Chloroflexota bacterium]
MNRATVSIVRADEYDYDKVYPAVEKSLDLIGGLETIVKPGSRVFVKINHLSPASEPDKAIITHPVFVQAVLEMLKKADANITVGDDIDSRDGDGFQVSGFRQMCEKTGVRLVNLRETGFVETKCDGRFLKSLHLPAAVLDADIIVNLPKLKTHSLTIFTGGVKNMYGIIPQGLRTRFHGDYVRIDDFCQMLTDVFSTAIPQLTIMDGIVAMEGDGPSSGKPRQAGVVLAGRDAVAVDAVATKITGVDPLDIYTTRYADEQGLGVGNLENIDIVGERLEEVSIPDFKLPSSAANIIMKRIPKFLFRFIQAQIATKPQVIKRQCTQCLACEEMCPVNAIAVRENRPAKIDKNICIACMCCHEVCRSNAVKPVMPVMGRAIYVVYNFLKR